MKASYFFMVLSFTGMIFASCSDFAGDRDELSAKNTTIDEKSAEVTALCGTCNFTETLTEAEIAGLTEMREEEKLAREVYLAMNTLYNQLVFVNIAKSEDIHTNAVLSLINGFGLSDPTPAAAIGFSNPLFSGLYDQLTEKGAVSLIEAFKTGAFIEEYDIADLERLLSETENASIAKVYENLLSGSENHLRAFTNVLAQSGENYSPVVISQEKYNQILSEKSTASYHQNGNQNTVNQHNK